MTDERFVEVNCQTPNCKNKVKILKGAPYFGILCSECIKPKEYTQ